MALAWITERMQFRRFGRTDWQVSEIAFGAWQIGGDWGTIDDAESVKTLLHAYEKGINFVDTAELYGRGRSEEVVGKSLKEWRGSRIYVATKVQPTVWPGPDDDRPQMRGRYPEWHLRTAVELSLVACRSNGSISSSCTAGSPMACRRSTGSRP
jgi:aryl-alcohol dehydrogenase-like predicted oxidoreductase